MKFPGLFNLALIVASVLIGLLGFSTAHAQDLSVSTEKILEVISLQQLEQAQEYRDLSAPKKLVIEETMRQHIRAFLKTKSFSATLFSQVVQRYPDFIAFKIIYSTTKNLIVNPLLAYTGHYQILSFMMMVPEDYAVYGIYRTFTGWYQAQKMRNRYGFTVNERDELLSQLLLADDYKKLQLYLIQNEKDLLVVPISKDAKSESGLTNLVTTSDLEKLVDDKILLDGLSLLSLERFQYQNILINEILSQDDGQTRFWNLLEKHRKFKNDRGATLLAQVLQLQKSLRLASLKFNANNFLALLREKNRFQFFKQRKIVKNLLSKVETLENMKWKIAQQIKKGVLNEEAHRIWSNELQRLQDQSENYLEDNMLYTKVGFCPAVFIF